MPAGEQPADPAENRSQTGIMKGRQVGRGLTARAQTRRLRGAKPPSSPYGRNIMLVTLPPLVFAPTCFANATSRLLGTQPLTLKPASRNMIKRALPMLALAVSLASTNMTAHAQSKGDQALLDALVRKGVLTYMSKSFKNRLFRGKDDRAKKGRESAEYKIFSPLLCQLST
jgi:hypothetical protein